MEHFETFNFSEELKKYAKKIEAYERKRILIEILKNASISVAEINKIIPIIYN